MRREETGDSQKAVVSKVNGSTVSLAKHLTSQMARGRRVFEVMAICPGVGAQESSLNIGRRLIGRAHDHNRLPSIMALAVGA